MYVLSRTAVEPGAKMPPPPPPYPREEERLDAVREAAPHTRTNDPAMVRLADEARLVCGTSVGMVSLLEEQEEWVVACLGTEAERIPRAVSFCAHTILEADVLVVDDASRDRRFAADPFVIDAHHLRFYAGAPIFDGTGLPLGAVCVCDAEPKALSSSGALSLRRLAEVASAVLQSRTLLTDAQIAYASRAERAATADRFDALLLELIGLHPG